MKNMDNFLKTQCRNAYNSGKNDYQQNLPADVSITPPQK